MLTHFGTEHYCPISTIRILGSTMIEEYEYTESQRDGTNGIHQRNEDDSEKVIQNEDGQLSVHAYRLQHLQSTCTCMSTCTVLVALYSTCRASPVWLRVTMINSNDVHQCLMDKHHIFPYDTVVILFQCYLSQIPCKCVVVILIFMLAFVMIVNVFIHSVSMVE